MKFKKVTTPQIKVHLLRSKILSMSAASRSDYIMDEIKWADLVCWVWLAQHIWGFLTPWLFRNDYATSFI